jgi:hypothetical protein
MCGRRVSTRRPPLRFRPRSNMSHESQDGVPPETEPNTAAPVGVSGGVRASDPTSSPTIRPHHVALLQRIPATDPKLRAATGEWLTELRCADTLYLDWAPPGVQNLSETLETVADSPDSRTQRADTSTPLAGAVSDTSAGVADSLATCPPATAQVSVSTRCTDRPNGQVSDTAQTSATSAPQMSNAVPSAVSDTHVPFTQPVRHHPSMEPAEQTDDGHCNHHPSPERSKTGQCGGQPRRRGGHVGHVPARVRERVRHVGIRAEAGSSLDRVGGLPRFWRPVT